MPGWVMEILIIFALILINGVLAMAEIAIVSARQNRLQQRANQGDERSAAALKLAQDPTGFLSTVQIGITLVGVLTSVFGGARIANHISLFLAQFFGNSLPGLVPYSDAIGLGFVVLLITYFTLVLGELAPKRVGLGYPERIARSVAIPMQFMARVMAPIVSILRGSTSLVLKIFGFKPSTEPQVTDEDVKALLQLGAQEGVFEASEEDMVAGIFRLSDLRVGSLMTPRSEITWIDIEDPMEVNQQKIATSLHARFPVGRGSLDEWIGIVQTKDLLSQMLSGQPLDLLANLIEPLVVPENILALKVLELFKEGGVHTALVVDEFGTLQGLVTIFDILEAIVGDIPVRGEPVDALAIQREDGSWLLDGRLSIEDFKEIFKLETLPDESRGYYQTLAGFVITMIGRIPKAADHFDYKALRFEVIDMDGFRIDKVIVQPSSSPVSRHPLGDSEQTS